MIVEMSSRCRLLPIYVELKQFEWNYAQSSLEMNVFVLYLYRKFTK